MSWVSLMFHEVSAGEPASGGGPERFTVSLSSFERMLDAIAAQGRIGCSLERALAAEGDRPVAITFDDGTIGQFDNAVPALRARGMTATFFVTTEWVGTPGYMTWDQLGRLRGWGMSVQSHTLSHPHLSELDEAGLRAELAGSKAALDERLGQVTTQIALPGGNAPRPGLRRLLGESGYGVVATSRWGRNGPAPGRVAHGARWIRRCNAPRSPSPELAARVVSGDARLALRRYAREATLNGVRAVVGANRYARWRRRVLDGLASQPT